MNEVPRHQSCIGRAFCPNPPTWIVYSTLGGITKDRATCDEHRDAFWQTHNVRPLPQATDTHPGRFRPS